MTANNAAKISLTTVCFIMGIFISFQVKAINHQKTADNIGLQRANEISAQLAQTQAEKTDLQTQLEDAQEMIRSYEQTFAQQSSDNTAFINELDADRRLASLTDMVGRGVEVTLTDSQNPLESGVSANVLLIHDEDLLNIINELNAAGCEALAINGQRYTATSAVRCVGPTISINGVKTAPPFVISAIGDPDVLDAALTLPGGIIDMLAPWGIQVDVEKMPAVVIPKYDGSFTFREASEPTGEADVK